MEPELQVVHLWEASFINSAFCTTVGIAVFPDSKSLKASWMMKPLFVIQQKASNLSWCAKESSPIICTFFLHHLKLIWFLKSSLLLPRSDVLVAHSSWKKSWSYSINSSRMQLWKQKAGGQHLHREGWLWCPLLAIYPQGWDASEESLNLCGLFLLFTLLRLGQRNGKSGHVHQNPPSSVEHRAVLMQKLQPSFVHLLQNNNVF